MMDQADFGWTFRPICGVGGGCSVRQEVVIWWWWTHLVQTLSVDPWWWDTLVIVGGGAAWDWLFFMGVWTRGRVRFMFLDSSACVVTLMLWLVGQRAFDDMLNEGSGGAARQGGGGGTSHIKHWPPTPPISPRLSHSLFFPHEARRAGLLNLNLTFIALDWQLH